MKKNKVKTFKSKLTKSPWTKVFLSLLGTLGLYYIIKSSIADTHLIIANLAIFPAFILFLFYWFKLAKLKPKSRIIFHSIFSFLLSCIFIFGGQLNIYGQIFLDFPNILKIFLGIFTIFPFLEIIHSFLSSILFKPNFTPHKKFKLLAFLIPLLVCFIVWIIFLPGIYTYDMAAWNESLSSGSLTSHWSITYGYFLKIFLDSSFALFNNYEVGFATAMLIQMVFICYVIYKVILFTTSFTKNKATFFISLLFFILTPFIATMSITDAQDTAFGGFFVLLILELYSIFHQPEYFKKKRHIFKFILIAFILITLRNNGLACLLLLTLFIIFIKIPNKKNILLSLLAVFVLNFIYTGPVFQLLHVEKNTTAVREILGVPSQQVARAYFENPSSFNEEDIKKINTFYNLEELSFNDYPKYPLISDFTKGALRLDYVNDHLFEYLGFWSSIGVKNPGNYLEAFLLNSIGFWYPMKNYDDPRIKLGYMNYSGFAMTTAFNVPGRENMKPVNRVLPNNDITNGLDNIIFSNGWHQIPIVAQLSSIGLYSLIFLYCIGLLIKNKSIKLLAILSPAIGLFITLLVAPVAIYRYAFPIALLVPIFICFIINTIQQKTA